MPNDEIHLKLTTEEANILLEALGNLPFIKVYALIGKIQSQAAAQVATATSAAQQTQAGLES